MHKYLPLLWCCFLFFYQNGNGQETHFSNLQYAPLQLNPALTGVMPKRVNARLTLQHRDQWRKVLGNSSYQTSVANFDYRVCSINRNEYFSFGVGLLRDQAGDANFLTQQAKISGAYLRPVAGDVYISVGTEVGAINYRLDDSNLRYDSQYDGFSGHDSSLPTNENIARMQTTLLDWGVGVEVFRILNKNTGAFVSFGGTLKHLNQPTYSFLVDPTAPTAAELKMLQQFSLRFGTPEFKHTPYGYDFAIIYARQGAFQQILIQPDLRISIGEAARYQLFLRPAVRLTNRFDRDVPTHFDALILATGFDLGRTSIQFAYDVNLSGLRTASLGRGGAELSATFYLSNQSGCGRVHCPDY